MKRSDFLKKIGLCAIIAPIVPKMLVGMFNHSNEQKSLDVHGVRQPTMESLVDLKSKVIEKCINGNNFPWLKNIEYIRYCGYEDGSCCIYKIYD